MPREIAPGRSLGRSLLMLAVAVGVGTLALGGYAAVAISAQGNRDEQQAADAIVVLGAAQFNGTPGGVFEARLQHAVDLFEANLANYLIVTGGKLPGDQFTEAGTAKRWAIAHGVPASAILSENKGRNTLESIEAVEKLMREHGLASAVFVSDETHMLRVLRMASDVGITAYGSPTRTSPTDLDDTRRRKAMLHELAGLAAYYLGVGRLLEDEATTSAP